MGAALLRRDSRRRQAELKEQIRALRADLAQARERIRELEEALHKACDYAEVCEHFPGREALFPSDRTS